MISNENSKTTLWMVLVLLALGSILYFAVARLKANRAILRCQDLVSSWSQTIDQIENPIRLWQEWGMACLERGFLPIELSPNGNYKVWLPTQVNYVKPISDNLFKTTHPLEPKDNLQAWMCQKHQVTFIGATRQNAREMRTNLITRESAPILFVEELNLKAQDGAASFHITKEVYQDNPEIVISFSQDQCELSKKIPILPPKSKLPIFFNRSQRLSMGEKDAS